ncbi:MAG TPA: HAD family phosphatase [Nocardioidaceae bacterium]|nr:HAD family phosphatase [Nocardioidaceae bacterium]
MRGLPAALLLDLDGTLVDSEPIHRAAYQAFFAERGWDVGDLALFTGRRAADVFDSAPGPWSGGDPVALAAAVVSCIPPGAVPAPIEGARALVEAAAAAGVQVAVVTSAGPEWAERSLADALGVRRHVHVIVTGDEVVDGKPDPAGFALACERLGVSAADCIAVEDSPAGAAAALAAGVVNVYGLSTTHPSQALTDAGATEVYADLAGFAVRIGLTGRRPPPSP